MRSTMRVKNFVGFMKLRNRANESYMDSDHMGYMPDEDAMGMENMPEDDEELMYGANPEEDEADEVEGAEGEEMEGEETDEEVTLEDIKAMIEDLTDRVTKLEGGGEEEEEPAEGEEGEEGEEAAEGEEGEEVKKEEK